MTLGFSLYFDSRKKHPTHFPQKIIRSLDQAGFNAAEVAMIDDQAFEQIPGHTGATSLMPRKIHTIRLDEKSRWEAGKNIHFVIGNRTKDRYQFAPVVKCTGVQDVFMTYSSGNGLEISIDGKYHYWRSGDLPMNDGFDSMEDFEAYFIRACLRNNNDGCFSGKIIHWTDFRY